MVYSRRFWVKKPCHSETVSAKNKNIKCPITFFFSPTILGQEAPVIQKPFQPKNKVYRYRSTF